MFTFSRLYGVIEISRTLKMVAAVLTALRTMKLRSNSEQYYSECRASHTHKLTPSYRLRAAAAARCYGDRLGWPG